MKPVWWPLLIAQALGMMACSTTGPHASLPGFRHIALTWPELDQSHATGSRPVLSHTRPTTTTRCTLAYRHPVLNRCQSGLAAPGTRPAGRPARAFCERPAGECRLALANRAREGLRAPGFAVGSRSYSRDCYGFVMSVLATENIPIEDWMPARRRGESGVSLLYRAAQTHGLLHHHKVPAAGDLVFFDNTYDRNRNRIADDPLTHVGIVERVDADGTISIIHHARRGVLRTKMNLFTPGLRRDPKTGKVLNHYLRFAGATGAKRLTGQLFRAFATLIR